MSYKVTKKADAYEYTAPGHNNCKCTRLADPQDVNQGVITAGLTYFQPGGGCDFGGNPLESVYFIHKGQMLLKTETEEVLLTEGDVFHCGPFEKKSVTNTGDTVTEMYVCLTKPE